MTAFGTSATNFIYCTPQLSRVVFVKYASFFVVASFTLFNDIVYGVTGFLIFNSIVTFIRVHSFAF